MDFTKTDVVKTVLKFGIENVQNCIGDCKLRDIGSNEGQNLLVSVNNFVSIFLNFALWFGRKYV